MDTRLFKLDSVCQSSARIKPVVNGDIFNWRQWNLYEIHPDGKMYKNDFYFFPGYNQIDFYADSQLDSIYCSSLLAVR